MFGSRQLVTILRLSAFAVGLSFALSAMPARATWGEMQVHSVRALIWAHTGLDVRAKAPIANWTYDIVQPDFAKAGRKGRVTLVRRHSDGELFVLKTMVDQRPVVYYDFALETYLAMRWRQYGLSTIEVFRHPDGVSLLKSYVPGPTLESLMEADLDFYSHPSVERMALKRFLLKAVRSQHYVFDMNPGNLIFDGVDFQLVDSRHLQDTHSLPATIAVYRQRLGLAWSWRGKHEKTPAILAFVESVLAGVGCEADLALR